MTATQRVLLTRHLAVDGEFIGHGEYCGRGCGQAVTALVQRECGPPRFTTAQGVTVYGHADGSSETHEWVDRRAVVCCGAGCSTQMAKSA